MKQDKHTEANDTPLAAAVCCIGCKGL